MCFASVWDNNFISEAKNFKPFPCIPIFDELLKISKY